MPDSRLYYRFTIDSFTPETLPLHRLAEYISDLAVLLGSREHVHFVKLDRGSSVPVVAVEYTAVPKVRDRLESVKRGSAPPEALRAFKEIDRRLAEDNATGDLRESRRKATIITFPGRNRRLEQAFGPFIQVGSLDGELIRVGGEQAIVPVHIDVEGRVLICQANRAVAREIAHHLFGPPLRVYGNGTWERTPEGAWVMSRFTIERFTLVDDAPLDEVVEKISRIEGGISSLSDPLRELEILRHGNDE